MTYKAKYGEMGEMVYQFDKEGKYIKGYHSVANAAEHVAYLGITAAQILNSCHSGDTTIGGKLLGKEVEYHWDFPFLQGKCNQIAGRLAQDFNVKDILEGKVDVNKLLKAIQSYK